MLLATQRSNTLLENPIWSSLTTAHARFSDGDERARCFISDIGPLAATRDQQLESYESLQRLLPSGSVVGMFLDEAGSFKGNWQLEREVPAQQMVWAAETPVDSELAFETLGPSDVDAMLVLTSLTNPGPFGPCTHQLGNYIGVRENGKLIAMAGERLRMPGLTEVSAVCTHPEHRGRGYARELVSILVRQILQRDETPFLHVATANRGAIRVYESLGFMKSREFVYTVLRKK